MNLRAIIQDRKSIQNRLKAKILKIKEVSGFDGDKQKASGHRTSSMVARYDRKREEIEGTR